MTGTGHILSLLWHDMMAPSRHICAQYASVGSDLSLLLDLLDLAKRTLLSLRASKVEGQKQDEEAELS